MEPRAIHELAASCGGQLMRGDARAIVRRVTIDSRHVQAGDLFVAIRGERHDGHRFVAEAVQRGAVGVAIESGGAVSEALDCCVVRVEGTRRALGDMASWHRRGFNIPVVAVVGSNGKTTTKNLVASVLAARFRTLFSEASYNNDIGVPLTLLGLDRSHEAAVVEAGTNHPGELAPLLEMIRPTMGVLTGIGREHLEFFGDLDGVLDEEGVIGEHVDRDGVLFVNSDAPGIERVTGRARVPVVRVGCGGSAQWRVLSAVVGDEGTEFALLAPVREYEGKYKLRLLGKHQAVNAALAVAVGARLGLSRDEIASGLLSCAAAAHRMQMQRFGGVRVLDDTYNANADSMRAALDTLKELPCKGRRIAVLGEMCEQGSQSEALHAEVGGYAVRAGVSHIFAVGRWARVYGEAARRVGRVEVWEFDDKGAAAAALCDFVREGDLVLVKASRVMKMEEIVEAVRLRCEGAGDSDCAGGDRGRGCGCLRGDGKPMADGALAGVGTKR